jgi:hypothetical protein
MFYFEDHLTNRHTLSMIKSEYKNQNKFSNDIFIDAEAARVLCDQMCLNVGNNLKGYIREIGLFPFQFILISDIQVNNFSILKYFLLKFFGLSHT